MKKEVAAVTVRRLKENECLMVFDGKTLNAVYRYENGKVIQITFRGKKQVCHTLYLMTFQRYKNEMDSVYDCSCCHYLTAAYGSSDGSIYSAGQMVYAKEVK